MARPVKQETLLADPTQLWEVISNTDGAHGTTRAVPYSTPTRPVVWLAASGFLDRAGGTTFVLAYPLVTPFYAETSGSMVNWAVGKPVCLPFSALAPSPDECSAAHVLRRDATRSRRRAPFLVRVGRRVCL